MKSLQIRVISAVAAIVLFAGSFYFFGAHGIAWLAIAAVLVGSFEFMNMSLKPLAPPTWLLVLFMLNCINILFTLLYAKDGALWAATLFIVYFIFFSVWSLHKKFDNTKMLHTISLSVLGFVYSILLPSFAIKLLLLDHGAQWFLFLLGIVFAGDIFAYFGGVSLGRTKIMPNISPGKTLAGCLSGIIGSVIAGILIGYYLIGNISLVNLIFFSALAALLAQTGDLFESLIKRVAQVKDSGTIMPGHGGVLDRLDGIYFAAPLIYALASHT
jgi:phosphatidate cytidylyltransferase